MSAVEQVETKRLDERRSWSARSAPRLLGLGVVVVAVVGAYVFGAYQGHRPAVTPTAPAAYTGFLPAEIDLGDQMWAQIVPFQLTFVNGGPEQLVIRSAQSSCDCTVIESAGFVGRTLQGGESLTIDVSLHTLNNAGLKQRQIEFLTDSGARYAGKVNVNVHGTWNLTPDAVDFGDVVLEDAEDPAPRGVIFESQPDQLIDVSAPGVSWIDWQTTQMNATTTEVQIFVRAARLQVGQSSASLVFRTSSTIKATGVVFVKAKGVHELTSSPTQVLLVGGRHQRVEFFDRAGDRARIVSVEAGSPQLTTALSDEGTIDIWNPSGQAISEAVPVRVVDERGKSRVLHVSAF